MDGIVLLKDDHKMVEGLFKRFERDPEAAEKRKLVDQMIAELTTHTFIEETIFYPAARADVSDSDDDVLESVEEHHVVVWLLSELQKVQPVHASHLTCEGRRCRLDNGTPYHHSCIRRRPFTST